MHYASQVSVSAKSPLPHDLSSVREHGMMSGGSVAVGEVIDFVWELRKNKDHVYIYMLSLCMLRTCETEDWEISDSVTALFCEAMPPLMEEGEKSFASDEIRCVAWSDLSHSNQGISSCPTFSGAQILMQLSTCNLRYHADRRAVRRVEM